MVPLFGARLQALGKGHAEVATGKHESVKTKAHATTPSGSSLARMLRASSSL